VDDRSDGRSDWKGGLSLLLTPLSLRSGSGDNPASPTDGDEQIIIVTGGNSGTGYETCKAYYERGATVYMASRSSKLALQAIQDIERGGIFTAAGVQYPKEGGGKVAGRGKLEFLELDLADLESVERFVQQYTK
jgi:NAD(P)-dependent dehydrogenase (short-subunit alcohol dehydrogenase family)